MGAWVELGWGRKLYSFRLIPIQLCFDSYIAFGAKLYSFVKRPVFRLLLRVGIKVVDERLISMIYVRGSNIYVRGYLDLLAWSLRLRA